MSFNASLHELADILNVIVLGQEKSSARYFALKLDDVQVGSCYLDLNQGISDEERLKLLEEAFNLGASILIATETLNIPDSYSPWCLKVPDTKEAFEKILTWWHSFSKVKSAVFTGDKRLSRYVGGITASILLDRKYGAKNTGVYVVPTDSLSLVTNLVNGEAAGNWSIWYCDQDPYFDTIKAILKPDIELNLEPNLLATEESETFEYVGEGKFLYTSNSLSLPLWRVPYISAARAVKIAFNLVDKIAGVGQDQALLALDRFIPPYDWGTYRFINDDTFLWIDKLGHEISSKDLEFEINMLDRFGGALEQIGVLTGAQILPMISLELKNCKFYTASLAQDTAMSALEKLFSVNCQVIISVGSSNEEQEELLIAASRVAGEATVSETDN